MRELFSFPDTAGGLFLTGTSQANFVAVLLAKTRALGATTRAWGLPTTTRAQTWDEYRPAGIGFRIEMPGKPKLETQKTKAGNTAYQAIVGFRDMAFLAIYATRDEKSPLDTNTLLDAAVKGMTEGKTVLSYFNASTGNMEVRVADDPTRLGTAPATTVVFAGKWPEPADLLPPPEDIQLAQPYGGYISPGSTLDELRGASGVLLTTSVRGLVPAPAA